MFTLLKEIWLFFDSLHGGQKSASAAEKIASAMQGLLLWHVSDDAKTTTRGQAVKMIQIVLLPRHCVSLKIVQMSHTAFIRKIKIIPQSRVSLVNEWIITK